MGSAPNARLKFYPRLVETFYRPSSNEAYVENLRASLERIPVQDTSKLPNIDWTPNRFRPCGRHPAQSKAMIVIALDHNLQ